MGMGGGTRRIADHLFGRRREVRLFTVWIGSLSLFLLRVLLGRELIPLIIYTCKYICIARNTYNKCFLCE